MLELAISDGTSLRVLISSTLSEKFASANLSNGLTDLIVLIPPAAKNTKISRIATEPVSENRLFDALNAATRPLQTMTENGAAAVTSGPPTGMPVDADTGLYVGTQHAQVLHDEKLEAALTDFFGRCTRDLTPDQEKAFVDQLVAVIRSKTDRLDRAKAISLIFRFLFNLRDIRGDASAGGKGERDLAYRMLVQLLSFDKELVFKFLHLFVREYGSYGDLERLYVGLKMGKFTTGEPSSIDSELRAIFADHCSRVMVSAVIADAVIVAGTPEGEIPQGVSLAAKHAPREGNGPISKMTTEEAKWKARFSRWCAWHYLHHRVGDQGMVRQTVDQTINGNLTKNAKISARTKWRQLCAELSRRLDVVEQKMSAHEPSWSKIVPAKVCAKAASKYRRAFQNMDKAGNKRLPKGTKKADDRDACAKNFDKAMEKAIETGKGINGKVNGAHGLVKHCMGASAKHDKMCDAQWSNLITELKADIENGGGLTSCLALCDVSGSMSGIPMEVCIALGLVLSEIAPTPWKGQVLTFASNPTWHRIQGSTLIEKVRNLKAAPWGCSTNFAKALNLILDVGKEAKLPPDAMPRTLFIFSDMQVNQAEGSSSGYGNSHYYRDGAESSESGLKHPMANIRRAFAEAGYECPHIVFWNLRGSCDGAPCETISEGVSQMSGYSESMLKAFMSGKIQDFAHETPWDRVKKVLDEPRYDAVHKIVMEHYGVSDDDADDVSVGDESNASRGDSDDGGFEFVEQA